MKHLMLNASVKTAIAKDRAIDTVRATFKGEEDGDIVQTVIIIALFVLICVVVGKLLYDSIKSQAGKTANCIQSVNTNSCRDFDNN